MLKEKVNIKFLGMESSDALSEYILEKMFKREVLLEEATSIDVFFKNEKNSRGVEDDFRMNINVNLPNSLVRVEERGEDMYANIDRGMDTLDRRLERYRDRRAEWEGSKPWKILEAEAAIESLTKEVEESPDDYSDYIVSIVRRKKIKDIGPMEEAEAIERMELLGYDQYLFKNKSTGKISMIYRREEGGYGIVEPEDE